MVKVVILILITFSILSWAIIIQRIYILSIAAREIKIFGNKFWSSIELSSLYRESHKRKTVLVGIEKIFYSGFKEFIRLYRTSSHSPEAIINGVDRAMHISINYELEVLKEHIPFLGTVGSISPYIGLFGTVWGIMHALITIGTVKQATLQMISPSVAEALITTTIGLFTAIPAVIGFNRLNQCVNKLEFSYDNFAEEFIAILHRQVFMSIDIRKGNMNKES